jgi:hypothetical protein
MKLPPDALGLLSKGMTDEAKARWPWLAWVVDLMVVAGQVQLLVWLAQALHIL